MCRPMFDVGQCHIMSVSAVIGLNIFCRYTQFYSILYVFYGSVYWLINYKINNHRRSALNIDKLDQLKR